jgi:hypothetical protein
VAIRRTRDAWIGSEFEAKRELQDLFRYFSNTRDNAPTLFPTKLWSDERVFFKKTPRALETKHSNRRKARSLPVEGRPPQSVFEISVGFRIDLGAVAAL